MKRCPNCQKECNDQSRFCPHCGGVLDTGETKRNNAGKIEKPDNTRGNKKLIGIVAAVVAVVAIMVLCISLMGGRSSKQLVKDMETGMKEADGDIIIGLLPPEMIDYELENSNQSIVQIKEEVAESVEYTMEQLSDQLGEDYTFSLTLDEQTDYDEDELDDVRRHLARDYSIERDTVKAGATLDIVFSVKGEGLETSNTLSLEAVKIGKDWYFIDISMMY